MKLYKLGKVISQGKTYIIFECNNDGIIVHVNYPKDFNVDKNLKIFVYEYKSEYSSAIYGFRTFNERVVFEDLLTVTGIGPKTAMSILAKGGKNILNAIIDKNVDLLTSVKSVGPSTANQIVFELRPKYAKMQGIEEGKLPPGEIMQTLKTLGFTKTQINFAVQKIEASNNLEDMVEKAIFIISNEYKSTSAKL